jgi:hypothetical protein
MEPLNDEELNEFLRQWKAPDAPASLVERFFPRGEPMVWWRWLWSGSIHVPVPLGLAVLAILALSAVYGFAHRQPVAEPHRAVSLADFQPVRQIQPRIIRSENAAN